MGSGWHVRRIFLTRQFQFTALPPLALCAPSPFCVTDASMAAFIPPSNLPEKSPMCARQSSLNSFIFSSSTSWCLVNWAKSWRKVDVVCAQHLSSSMYIFCTAFVRNWPTLRPTGLVRRLFQDCDVTPLRERTSSQQHPRQMTTNVLQDWGHAMTVHVSLRQLSGCKNTQCLTSCMETNPLLKWKTTERCSSRSSGLQEIHKTMWGFKSKYRSPSVERAVLSNEWLCRLGVHDTDLGGRWMLHNRKGLRLWVLKQQGFHLGVKMRAISSVLKNRPKIDVMTASQWSCNHSWIEEQSQWVEHRCHQ